MELHEIKAKLKTLRNKVEKMLNEKPNEPIFEVQMVQDIFDRYATLRDELRSNHSYFNDLPVREEPRKASYEEKPDYIERKYLELLLSDIDCYCLDILSDITMVDVSAMKVTREGVFFAGQYYDALRHVAEILSDAQQSIMVIDGYIDEKVLDLLTSKRPTVGVNILTKDASVTPSLRTAATAFNKQYGKLSIRASKVFHDRFVIVDDRDFYHFGASLKDLGHRGCMFSRIEEPKVIDLLRTEVNQEWARATVEV